MGLCGNFTEKSNRNDRLPWGQKLFRRTVQSNMEISLKFERAERVLSFFNHKLRKLSISTTINFFTYKLIPIKPLSPSCVSKWTPRDLERASLSGLSAKILVHYGKKYGGWWVAFSLRINLWILSYFIADFLCDPSLTDF